LVEVGNSTTTFHLDAHPIHTETERGFSTITSHTKPQSVLSREVIPIPMARLGGETSWKT